MLQCYTDLKLGSSTYCFLLFPFLGVPIGHLTNCCKRPIPEVLHLQVSLDMAYLKNTCAMSHKLCGKLGNRVVIIKS